jgi:uncharacterized membrane protein
MPQLEVLEGNQYVPVNQEETILAQPVPQTQLGAPAKADWSLSSMFGLINIVAGLMLVASILIFFGGLVGYLSRLGLESRIQGLTYMYRGVSILFVLIVMLAIVRYVQEHPERLMMAIAVVIVLFGAWAIFEASKPAEEEH